MLTKTFPHFPQITFKDEEKRLWNPILKKAYKSLPEERVRLKLIEYLIYEVGFSTSRISFESPVNLPRDKSNSRTDVICHTNDFEPLLLVECKAPKVQLNEKASLQISRYNSEVGAPFLLITNGLKDFWFEMTDGTLAHLDEIPEQFSSKKTIHRDFTYWVDRGFAGKNSHTDSLNWIKDNCNKLYVQSTNPPRFFPFEGTDPELVLTNYYQVLMVNEQTRLAVAFSGTPFGTTKLNAILNQGGQNTGLLSASIDLLAVEEPQNTIIQTASGVRNIDLKEEIGFSFDEPLTNYTSDFARLMS